MMATIADLIHDKINLGRVAFICAAIAMAFVVFNSGLSMWDRWHEVNVATFKWARTHEATVHVGDVVHYSVRSDKHYPYAAYITRKLHPVGNKHADVDVHPSVMGSGEVGEWTYDRFFTVPQGTPPGKYQLRMYFDYTIPTTGKHRYYLLDAENTIEVLPDGT